MWDRKENDQRRDQKDRIVCRCEEILESEIVDAVRNGARTVTEVKRRTRAGMGLCQGKTCEKLVKRIIGRELGLAPDDVEAAAVRPPVRPVSLGMYREDSNE